jgi:hypothetical protein
VKKAVLLNTLSLVAVLMFASTAFAQGTVGAGGCSNFVTVSGAQYCSATPSANPPLTGEATGDGAAQDQYVTSSPSPTAFAGATGTAAAGELPATGGDALLAFGAGAFLVAGGLLARKMIR